ncbi:sulfatase, partial [Aquimarina celericrescens]|nr:sulfatase [Aquimarina celericrescens]
QVLEEPSYMIYFSDHGEEVFTDINFAGHMDDNPTKSMYEIRFFLWTNSKFKVIIPLANNLKLPYSIQYFMHSFSDLNGIKFEEFDSSKSIFSEDFKTQKRIIANDIDYDLYFENTSQNN